MLMCGVGAKPVAHLMKYHRLKWEVVKVKPLMKRCNNQDSSKKKRYKRDKIVADIPVER